MASITARHGALPSTSSSSSHALFDDAAELYYSDSHADDSSSDSDTSLDTPPTSRERFSQRHHVHEPSSGHASNSSSVSVGASNVRAPQHDHHDLSAGAAGGAAKSTPFVYEQQARSKPIVQPLKDSRGTLPKKKQLAFSAPASTGSPRTTAAAPQPATPLGAKKSSSSALKPAQQQASAYAPKAGTALKPRVRPAAAATTSATRDTAAQEYEEARRGRSKWPRLLWASTVDQDALSVIAQYHERSMGRPLPTLQPGSSERQGRKWSKQLEQAGL